MRTLAAKLLLLLLPLALLAGWFESHLRDMPNSYNQKWSLLEPRQNDLRVLVLGASQENQGIQAGLLDKDGFNLACVGQDYYYDRQMAFKVLAKAQLLRLVVLSLSYVSLGYELPFSPESWRQFSYRLYDGLPDEDPGARWDLRNFSALAFIEPGAALGDARRGFSGDSATIFGADGQQRVQALSKDQMDFAINEFTARKRLRYLDSIFREGDVPQNLAILSSLLEALRARGIRAAFITSPVTEDFRRAMDKKNGASTGRSCRFWRQDFMSNTMTTLATPASLKPTSAIRTTLTCGARRSSPAS